MKNIFDKYNFVTVVMLVALLLLTSCHKKKDPREGKMVIDQVEMTLNGNDTFEVLNQSKLFLETLKSKNLNAALPMIHYLDKDLKIVPLPDSLAKAQLNTFKLFPVLEYKIDTIEFFSETDCKVACTIKFMEKAKGSKLPNTIGLCLKPVRRSGKWYLTVADSKTDVQGGSHLKD